MYKIIDLLFSSYVNMTIYRNRIYEEENRTHKELFNESSAYFVIFVLFSELIVFTLGACDFVLVNLGAEFDGYEAVFIIVPISLLVSEVFVYKAKKKHFFENKLAVIETRSSNKMKKYIFRASFIFLIPFFFYPLMLGLICYLLYIFVFHG